MMRRDPVFTSTVTVEHNPAEEFALTPDDRAYFYPFRYDDEEFPDLLQFITPQYSDPNGELAGWGRDGGGGGDGEGGGGATGPEARSAEIVKLWRQRVDLMRQLVGVRVARAGYVGL